MDLSKIIQLMDSRMQAVPQTDKPGGIAATPAKETKDSGRRREAKSTGKVSQGKTAQKEKDNESTEDLAVKKFESPRTEAPDELWSIIKERVHSWGGDQALTEIMDHGNLIAFGPTEVEIGFTKVIYKEEFETRLFKKPEAKSIFEEYFGNARFKILTLARETSLASEKPYSEPANGQTAFDRALRSEAQENPITRAVLDEFEGSSIEEVKVISPKTS